MDSAALGHDFNNFWGSILGVTELHERPIASALMRQYWEDPAGAIRNFGKTLAQYTDMFEQVSIRTTHEFL
jgi:hypothetical protein